jgi:hypothetical protein
MYGKLSNQSDSGYTAEELSADRELGISRGNLYPRLDSVPGNSLVTKHEESGAGGIGC